LEALMKNHTAIITKKIKFFLGALFCLGVVWGTVFAQKGLEPARNSNLTGVALPANAQRVVR
jgi:hypothetical protein